MAAVSRSAGGMSGESSPAALPLAAWATDAPSMTSGLAPRRARNQAQAAPMTPPPTMAMSTRALATAAVSPPRAPRARRLVWRWCTGTAGANGASRGS